MNTTKNELSYYSDEYFYYSSASIKEHIREMNHALGMKVLDEVRVREDWKNYFSFKSLEEEEQSTKSSQGFILTYNGLPNAVVWTTHKEGKTTYYYSTDKPLKSKGFSGAISSVKLSELMKKIKTEEKKPAIDMKIIGSQIGYELVDIVNNPQAVTRDYLQIDMRGSVLHELLKSALSGIPLSNEIKHVYKNILDKLNETEQNIKSSIKECEQLLQKPFYLIGRPHYVTQEKCVVFKAVIEADWNSITTSRKYELKIIDEIKGYKDITESPEYDKIKGVLTMHKIALQDRVNGDTNKLVMNGLMRKSHNNSYREIESSYFDKDLNVGILTHTNTLYGMNWLILSNVE
jgi:hypothetical protein